MSQGSNNPFQDQTKGKNYMPPDSRSDNFLGRGANKTPDIIPEKLPAKHAKIKVALDFVAKAAEFLSNAFMEY